MSFSCLLIAIENDACCMDDEPLRLAGPTGDSQVMFDQSADSGYLFEASGYCP